MTVLIVSILYRLKRRRVANYVEDIISAKFNELVEEEVEVVEVVQTKGQETASDVSKDEKRDGWNNGEIDGIEEIQKTETEIDDAKEGEDQMVAASNRSSNAKASLTRSTARSRVRPRPESEGV